MKITTVLGAIAAAALFFFGVIFTLSAGYIDPVTNRPPANQAIRVVVGIIMIGTAIAIAFTIYKFTRKPTTVIHQVELSGQMKAAPIKCPNCSASVDATRIHVVSGVPYATCPYCGTTFEVAEEPKW